MAKKSDETTILFKLNIFSKGKGELLRMVEANFENSSKLSYIFTPNPEQIVISSHHIAFFEALQTADWLLPDGVGLVWASRLLSLVGKAEPLPTRIAGRDVVAALLEFAQRRGRKVLVIGGRGYDQAKSTKYRVLPVAKGDSKAEVDSEMGVIKAELGENESCSFFWTAGYQQVNNPTTAEEEQLKKIIEQLRPDLVLVAFGAPAQELWLVEHRAWLAKHGVRLGMAVGGSFDSLLGLAPPAPAWVSKIGLEWLFRLITQPWRWRRQLRLIEFMGMVFRELLTAR